VKWSRAVDDVYVYHFHPFIDGELAARSTVAATLATIEKLGKPIMASQIVVDQSEVDSEGFLIPAVGFGSREITTLSAKIKTLELRAASRDQRAESMSSVADAAAIYMLSLESRHLRQKAGRLIIERAGLLANESGHISVTSSYFASRSTAG
jgi:hypothetical protein